MQKNSSMLRSSSPPRPRSGLIAGPFREAKVWDPSLSPAHVIDGFQQPCQAPSYALRNVAALRRRLPRLSLVKQAIVPL